MNNIILLKNRILPMLFAVLILISCGLLCGCGSEDTETQSEGIGEIVTSEQDDSVGDDSLQSDAETVVADNQDSDASDSDVPDTDSENSLNFMSEYKPYTAYDENGSELDINFVYGTGYATYGGALCFLDDGTFTAYLGVGADDGSGDGTYRIISDTEIEMNFNNGDTEIATVTEVSNGYVTELQLFNRGFDVVFRGE